MIVCLIFIEEVISRVATNSNLNFYRFEFKYILPKSFRDELELELACFMVLGIIVSAVYRQTHKGLSFALQKLNYGALYQSEFILRFGFEQSYGSASCLELIKEYAKRSNLLHIEPSGDGECLNLTYDLNLHEGVTAEQLTSAFGKLEGVSQVILIASKNDVDY